MYDILLLVVLSILPFLPGLSHQFIFDDSPALLQNKGLLNESCWILLELDYWGSNLSSSSSHKSFRPLTSLSFWAQARDPMDGSVARDMKLVNLGMNSVNTLLSLLLVQHLFKYLKPSCSPLYSVSVSAMFAVHPVHVEPVLSIVGRSDLLYSTLFLFTALVELKYQPRGSLRTLLKYAFISLSTAASMLAKEQGILFLLFLALVQFLRSKSVKDVQFQLCMVYVLVNILVLSYLRLKVIDFQAPQFQQGDNPAAFEENLFVKFTSFVYIYALNCFLLLCPCWLCFDWALGCVPLIRGALDLRLFSVAALLLLAGALLQTVVIQVKHNYKLLPISLGLLVIPFLLCTNLLVRVGFVIAERNLYLPLLGYSLLYHCGLMKVATLAGKHMGWIYGGHCAALLVLLLKTLLRSSDWQTETGLYVSGLRVCPTNAKVHYNIAKRVDLAGDKALAGLYYKQSILLEPNFEPALNNLGNLLKDAGDYGQAEGLLRRAVRANPKFAAAHMNLAIVLQSTENLREAEEQYIQALQLRRPYPDCTFNLGNLYLKMGKLEQAETNFREGLGVKHELSYINLIVLLDQTGRINEARDLSEKGAAIFIQNPEFRFHLANCLGKMSEYNAAEIEYKRALALQHKSSYFLNLGVLYHRWGRLVEGEQAYMSALAVDTTNRNAAKYLKAIRRKL